MMPRNRVPTGRPRGRPSGRRRSVPLERITERRRREQRISRVKINVSFDSNFKDRLSSIKEENIAEPAMELSTEDTDTFPINSLSEEINEGESAANHDNEDKEKEIFFCRVSMFEESETYNPDSEADYIVPESTESSQEEVNYEQEPLIKLEPVESEVTNVPESSESTQDGVNYEHEPFVKLEPVESELTIVPESIKSTQADANFEHEPLVKLEPVESEEAKETNLEDFIYSNFNSSMNNHEEESNSTAEDSTEEARECTLSRSHKKIIINPATICTYKTPVKLKTSCICRYRCLAKTTEVQRRALLEYLEVLKKLKLFESYIFNFIEIIKKKKIGDDKQKFRACAYLYKVKFGYQEFLVCKDGFIDYHGLSQKRLLRFQIKLKTGVDLPPKLEMSQFPVFIPPQTNQKVSPRKSAEEFNNKDVYPQSSGGGTISKDNTEDFSDSDESISYEVNEKKANCIDLLFSGEESDDEKLDKTKCPKNAAISGLGLPAPNPVTSNTPSTNEQQSLATSSPSNTQTGGIRRLRDFKTICKIINKHSHEYLIDIFDLLYLRKHEPATLRKDILDFSGFTFGKRSTDYINRKLLLQRMQYNSINRIYNTLFPTTEVKVISKLAMITEIFQFLFKLPDQDTSVHPSQALKPETKTTVVSDTKTTIDTVLAPGEPVGTTTGKLSNLEGVFHKVACFPCEHLTEVHKLLFMSDCDPKVIRQNIYAFKGFEFGPASQEFQQRKKYLEDLTYFTLRKISGVLSAQPVDLRNFKNSAVKRKTLSTHLTQVLVEYCNTDTDTEIPEVQIDKPTASSITVTSTGDNTGLENIVCTPTKNQTSSNVEKLVKTKCPKKAATTVKPILNIPSNIVRLPTPNPVTSNTPSTNEQQSLATSSPSNTQTGGIRRSRDFKTNSHIESTTKPTNPKEPPKTKTTTLAIPIVSSSVVTTVLGSNIRKPNIRLYHRTVSGITTISASGISQTFRMNQPISLPVVQVQPSPSSGVPIKNPEQTKPTEVFFPGENITNEEEHPSKKQKTSSEETNSGKSVSPEKNSFHNKFNAFDEEEDCDKPLSSLIGHQSLLYKLLKQSDSVFKAEFKTNNQDCSVTTDSTR